MKAGIPEIEFEMTAQRLGCDVAAIKAVAEVESKGEAFDAQGHPTILFERHIFYKYAPKSKRDEWAKKYPNLCNPERGGYGKKAAQYSRLEKARQLDENAALMACSWGKYQIMGFHWKKLGYGSLHDFVRAMESNEAEHLHAFICYVEEFGLTKALQSHNWKAFARGYNGPDYKANDYDTKLARAHEKFSKPSTRPPQNSPVTNDNTLAQGETLPPQDSVDANTPPIASPEPFFPSPTELVDKVTSVADKASQVEVSVSRSSVGLTILKWILGLGSLVLGFIKENPWEAAIGVILIVAAVYYWTWARNRATNKGIAQFVQDPGASK